MYVVVISCAAGIICGLPGEVRGKSKHLTITECQLAGELAIEFAGYDKRRFIVKCEEEKDGKR